MLSDERKVHLDFYHKMTKFLVFSNLEKDFRILLLQKKYVYFRIILLQTDICWEI